MPVLLDPTLALTRRGQTWVDRVKQSGCSGAVGVSDAFADPYRRLGDVLSPYRPRWRFSYWAPSYSFGPPLFTVRAHNADQVAAQLMAVGAQSAIAGDLWAGLQRGAWLAARRLPTIDRFVQAGAPVILSGSSGYQDALREIAIEIGTDLTAALGRRTRYLIADASRLRDFEWAPSLALVAFDAGTGNFH